MIEIAFCFSLARNIRKQVPSELSCCSTQRQGLDLLRTVPLPAVSDLKQEPRRLRERWDFTILYITLFRHNLTRNFSLCLCVFNENLEDKIYRIQRADNRPC